MIQVFSEIGNLKKVLVHRPSNELLNISMGDCSHLLFDDVPYLYNAQKEHDFFVKLLQDSGSDVVYTNQLFAESIINSEVKQNLISNYIAQCNIYDSYTISAIKDLLYNLSNIEMVDKMIAGIRYSDIASLSQISRLANRIKDVHILVDPMPNMLFTRDNFSSIHNGVSLNVMLHHTRRRESVFYDNVFTHHPQYKDTKRYYGSQFMHNIEGGDILVINEETLAVGVSERTESMAIEQMAANLFEDENSQVKTIYAMKIPSKRSCMHLDTVFTQIDQETFTVYPGITGSLRVFALTRDKANRGRVKIDEMYMSLKDCLKTMLNIDSVKLISCANGDMLDAEREQWNDGSNTLAIKPGHVIVYDRNHITNNALRDNGINVHEMPSGELSRGRGGPRCMSMPLIRDKIN